MEGHQMKDSQRRAMFAKISRHYDISSFHPTAFDKGVYAVGLHRKGQLRFDRNMELVQVMANNKTQAVKKAIETREMKIFIERTMPKSKSFDPVTASSDERIEETPKIQEIHNELMNSSKSFRESTPRTREIRVKRLHTLRTNKFQKEMK